MNNYDYPIGSDSDNAPWNEEVNKPKKVDVIVSVTISKPVQIEVSDYDSKKLLDEEGNSWTSIDYSGCDLYNAAREQIILPKDTKEFKDWDEDDFEVVLD